MSRRQSEAASSQKDGAVASTPARKVRSRFGIMALLAVVCVAMVMCLTACGESEPAATNDNGGTTAKTDESVHELVYIPLSSLGVEDVMFDEQALWGVTIDNSPQLVVMHIEKGVVDENGTEIPEADLMPGDVVEASFAVVADSYPGQINVETCTFVRHGGQEAIDPYQAEIDAYKSSAIDQPAS